MARRRPAIASPLFGPSSRRRVARSICLLFVFFSLSGCVYLRLLMLKNQLVCFDKNFEIRGRPELIIHFKNPVMYAKDARFLIGAPPLKKYSKKNRRFWYYEFDMVRHNGPENVPMEKLSLTLQVRKRRVIDLRIPETFMLLFPRNVIIETFRNAAHADVLKLKKTARARIRLSSTTDAELPSLQKTLKLMGPPLEITRTRNWQTLVYRYRIVKDKNDVPIIARLSFSEDNLLRHVHVFWDTATVDVTFLRNHETAPQR